ncbi:ubiquinol-cytochrome-c reductase complex assembly factor 3 [Pezoporus wallicus]|uniref:ubiquinol-cytochrome-c reductase complex assembly factor 3 n=1 Tax=Pezoporus wallicus TaxID=35540 RepID=UPI002551350D|nr:ubiquinol-cytochrome-c reductase complex assembly factor 3 [Pezoporus wallicus]
MAALRRWALALLRGSVPAAIGLLLWVTIESGDEKRQEMLKALPEANPEILAERRRHNRLIMAALREAAETNENVAQRPVPWRK